MKELKEKGITLIALVITIIILLILVGITISQVFGDNGLFQRTRQAVEKYKAEQTDEEMSLEELEKYLADFKFDSDNRDENQILDELKNRLQALESEKEALEQKVSELQTQNSELTKSNEENEKEIESLKSKVSEYPKVFMEKWSTFSGYGEKEITIPEDCTKGYMVYGSLIMGNTGTDAVITDNNATITEISEDFNNYTVYPHFQAFSRVYEKKCEFKSGGTFSIKSSVNCTNNGPGVVLFCIIFYN